MPKMNAREKFERRLDATLAKFLSDSEHKLRRRNISDDVLARELTAVSNHLAKLRMTVLSGAARA
jgi:hypothetical protein